MVERCRVSEEELRHDIESMLIGAHDGCSFDIKPSKKELEYIKKLKQFQKNKGKNETPAIQK